jgi:hypothetical protein
MKGAGLTLPIEVVAVKNALGLVEIEVVFAQLAPRQLRSRSASR